MTRSSFTKVGLAAGLLAPFAFMVLYAVAISQDSEYTFYENYLSDLGVGSGAWAFNSAVMMAGALTVVFAQLGLRSVFGRGVLDALSTSLLSLAGVFLFFIGVFTEDAGDVHYYFSVAFFVTAYVAVGKQADSFRRCGVLGAYGPAAALVTFLFGLALLPFGFNPQTETLAVLAILAWSVGTAGPLLIKEYRGPA